MPLSKPQQTISNSKKRFRVVIAGRRFGKTFLSIHEIAKVARFPDKNVYAVYPTYKSGKKVLWKTLKKKMVKLNWVAKINETELTLELKNGSVITIVGADNFDSLRGVGLDCVVMDEFQLVDKAAWTEVLRPALSDRQGNALFIGTPNGVGSFAHEMYNRGLDEEYPQWETFSFTTIDGGNVTEEELEQAKRDLDIRTFRQEYLATFESSSSRVFYAFDRKEHIKKWDKPTPKVIYVGMDFNVDPMSLVIFAREGDTLHAIDEICLFSSNTQEAVDEIKERYSKQQVWVFPDPACRQRKTSAGGATDLSILQNAQFTVKVPNSHNPVRDGINAVNSRLCNVLNQRYLFVDPKCKKTIEALEKHSYKEGSSQPDKGSGYDHMADAIRYAVEYMFPVRRDVDKDYQPQRFGHAIK